MKFEAKPLTVQCNSCGESAETWDYRHPDLAVECRCCPEKHDHAGLGCRTVTIYAYARLVMFTTEQLLELAAETEWDRQFDYLAPADR